MKARFSQPQQRVKTITSGEKIYIFLCLNETQGTETYPDMGDGQKQEAYYEYDYNEISGPFDKIPVDDIQAHPENYLEYVYTEQKEDPEDDRVKNLEEQVNSILNAIERGMNS